MGLEHNPFEPRDSHELHWSAIDIRNALNVASDFRRVTDTPPSVKGSKNTTAQRQYNLDTPGGRLWVTLAGRLKGGAKSDFLPRLVADLERDGHGFRTVLQTFNQVHRFKSYFISADSKIFIDTSCA